MAGKRKTAKKNNPKPQPTAESSTNVVDVVSTDDNNNNNDQSSSSKPKKPSKSKSVDTETVTLRRSSRTTTKASTAASIATTIKKTKSSPSSSSDSKSKAKAKSTPNRRNTRNDKSLKSEPIQEEVTDETPKGKKKSKAASSTTATKKAAASKKKVSQPEEINEESDTASTSVATKNVNKKKNAKNNKRLVVEEETEPLEQPPEPTPKRSTRNNRKKEPESIEETPKSIKKKPVKKSGRNNKKETVTQEEQEEVEPIESTEDNTVVASTSSKKRPGRSTKLTKQQQATIDTDSNETKDEASENSVSESKSTRPKRKAATAAPSTSKESKTSTRSTRKTAPSSSQTASAINVESVAIVVNIKSNKEPNKPASGQNNRNKKSVRFAKQVPTTDDNKEESEITKKTENDQKDDEQMEYVSSTTTTTTTVDHEEKEEVIPRIDEPDDEDMKAVTDEDDGQNDDKNQATNKSTGIKTTASNNEPAIEMETLMPSSTNESEEEKQQNYIVKEMENEGDADNIPDDNNKDSGSQDKKDAMITEVVENDEEQSEQLEEKEKISENDNKIGDNVIPLPPPPSIVTKQTESSTISNSNGSLQIDGDHGSKLVMDIDDDDAGNTEDNENDSKLKRKSTAIAIEDDLMPQKKRLREGDCGDLFTMGDQISKELGPRETNFNGKKVLRSEPSRVKIGSKVKISRVATGALHTLALTEDGKVLSFGCNDDCVLGRPLTREENSNGQADDDELMDVDDDDLEETLSGKPLPVKEINTKVVKVTAGDMHSAALCDDGKVYIWGNFKDESDKIGLFVDCEKSPSSSDYLPIVYPRQVEFDMNVVDIASGSHHLLMLTDQGKVYTFGEGSKGQLGRITSTELNSIKTKRDLFLRPNPVSIPDSDFIEHVFASQWNSYALSKDGVLYGWGLNNYYQLGIKNDFISQANSLNSGSLFTLIPTKIPIQLKVKQVANGQQHSLLLNDDGKVYSCGSALYGKLGHGEDFVKQCGEDYSISEFKNIPQKCFNDERIVKVDCGDFCSMAISESGKLFCWGQGASHIGTEDGVDLFEPKKISGAFADCTKFITISTGAQMASMVGIVRQQPEQQSN